MATHKLQILAQSVYATARRGTHTPTPGQWLAIVICGLSGVAAFGLVPGSLPEPVPTHVIELNLPLPTISVVEDESGGYWREERIQRGDTIGSALARLGVEDPTAMQFMRSDPTARAVYQLRPGKPVTVETDEDGHLLMLRFANADGSRLSISRDGERLRAEIDKATVEYRWKLGSGEISTSFFGATDAAGLPDAVTLQMAEVFGGDIDFYHDLRRGDRFAVVYEMRYVDGEPIGAGRIVAAEFENRGHAIRAFRWIGPDGRESYYDQDGAPLRKAFLRSPMEFSRVTSGFSSARFHPILQSWRAHKGVDFAAPLGTAVHATANGRVSFAGTQTGYGNVIQLQHTGLFSTLYAHLSRLAVKVGTRVFQGDIIGYVGQTGWATGPHLHYEFRVGNEQRNPLTVALPGAEPLALTSRAAFVESLRPAAAQLSFASQLPGRMFASGD
jgi:murein DD-endopeptidase MepM/ murein hydrolase activator NlpD